MNNKNPYAPPVSDIGYESHKAVSLLKTLLIFLAFSVITVLLDWFVVPRILAYFLNFELSGLVWRDDGGDSALVYDLVLSSVFIILTTMGLIKSQCENRLWIALGVVLANEYFLLQDLDFSFRIWDTANPLWYEIFSILKHFLIIALVMFAEKYGK